MAQLEQAEVEQELINAWHATWSVLAQLQVLTDGAPLTVSSDALHWSALQEHQKRSNTGPALIAVSSAPAKSAKSMPSWSTAAYVWDTSALLNREQRGRAD